jgi:hypothetical protein
VSAAPANNCKLGLATCCPACQASCSPFVATTSIDGDRPAPCCCCLCDWSLCNTHKHTEVLPFTDNVNINRGETQLTHVQRPSTATVGDGVQIRGSPDLTLATDTITVRGCNRAVLHPLLFAGATSITISKNSKMVHHCAAATTTGSGGPCEAQRQVM